MQVHKPHMHHEIHATVAIDSDSQSRHVDWLFEPVYHGIENRLEESDVDKAEIYETAHRIESEVLKGNGTNTDKLNRWLRMMHDVAPDILILINAALLKTDSGVSATVRTILENNAPQPVH